MIEIAEKYDRHKLNKVINAGLADRKLMACRTRQHADANDSGAAPEAVR